MGARDNVTAEISDSVTPFCDFLLSVLSGLVSCPARGGVFCSLTLPLTQNCARVASASTFSWTEQPKLWMDDCLTLLLHLDSPLPSQPPASLSHLSTPRVQGKAPGKPQDMHRAPDCAPTAKESPDNL